MNHLRATTILALAFGLAACSSTAAPFETETDAYWSSLDTVEKSTVCVALADNTGFELIFAASDDDGQIDLLDGGQVEDTHENRIAVGAQLDRISADECP